MTPERLRELIAGGESLAVEFKGESQRRLFDADLIDAVVCLANRPSNGKPMQAYRLLQKLVRKGLLTSLGARGRGVVYEKKPR